LWPVYAREFSIIHILSNIVFWIEAIGSRRARREIKGTTMGGRQGELEMEEILYICII